MLREAAIVVKVEKQDIWVRIDRQSVCGSCAANQGCGVSLVNQFFSKKIEHVPTHLKVGNGISQVGDFQVQVGDKVVVGLQENAFIKSALLVYFLPLVFMLGFSLFGQYFYTVTESINTLLLGREVLSSEGLTISFALVGLVSGFYIVKHVSRKISNDASFRAVLLEN
ncbi:MAG: SoxR reducing system RseC family protein [Gammaproteobacteria bacterium]|nr:SoxR reducing system RseC family protein [Gammaproteobacteria bacterium]